MDNETYFRELKNRFPNLNSVAYQDGKLFFPNGTLALNSFLLKDILPSTFMLQVKNIYYYLGYQYYKAKDEEITKVLELFPQVNLTEEDKVFLKNFARDYALRVSMYNEEAPILNQDEIFMLELQRRQKVIGESFTRNSEGAQIISSNYTEKINQSMNDNMASNNSLNQGLALTRTKNGLPPLIENNDNLGIAGFTTIFIVILTTVIAGVYIAWKFLN